MIKYKENQGIKTHRSKFTVQSFSNVIMENYHKVSKRQKKQTIQREILHKIF